MARLTTRAVLIATATTIEAAESIIGKEIQCAGYDVLSLFVDYTKGDETSLSIIPYSMFETGGDGFQFQTWTMSGAVRTFTKSVFSLTATGKYLMMFDVSGIEYIRFHQDATGGTPSGTIAAAYAMAGS